MVQTLNETDFAQTVLQAPGKVMVEFFATWCPHCQRMAPIVDALAKIASDCAIYRVDVDQSPTLASEYAPNGFPTFVLFEDGGPVETLTGEQTAERLQELIA